MAKRKRNKTAIAELKIWAAENSIIDEVVLEDRFYQCIERPDPFESVNRVMRIKFNSFLASIRNKSGTRIAFPVRNKDGSRSVHIIPGTTDLDAVSRVDERYTRNAKGHDKAGKSVKESKGKLIEQLSLFPKKVNK